MPAAKSPFLVSIIRFMRVRSYSERSIDTNTVSGLAITHMWHCKT